MRFKSLLLSAVLALGTFVPAFAADTYNIDTAHSSVGFAVKHLVISTVKGSFTDYSGTIQYDEKNPAASSVDVTIKTASINTGNDKRDAHLRNADFFDAEKFPEIKFVSKKVVQKANVYEMTGNLTMKGVTKEVVIPFTLAGPIQDPWGGTRMAAEGSLTINRQDYGVSWTGGAKAGEAVVSDEVKIDLNIEAMKAQMAKPDKTKKK
jgi:polyisoprenoid-binding protein YceI